ncbi:MAG: methyl-accepting chemotaxis protein [Candidatus Vecturithrix sp.]|jgi:methyl-accepting chemotaxis protein|nr:methyl-accepting chemotaxis protein [Candidatus Vecturithrix sp.]
MTLKKKIFFPVLGAIVLLGSLGYFIMQRELSKLDAYLSKQVVSEKQGKIDAMIRLTAEQAKQKAALFTQLPEVLQAFEIAHSGNINDEKDPKGQEAREFLRRVLKASMDGYTRVMNGNKLQLHFHLPSGHSLLRMWREKQSIRDENWEDLSDDISDFRHTVLDVNRSGQAVTGIEPGRGGFVVRGLAPIKTPQGKQLGSVEVLEDFNPLLESVIQRQTKSEKQSLFLFMNAELLSVTTTLQDTERYPRKADQYVLLYATDERYGEPLINLELLNRGKHALTFLRRGSVLLGGFPINDYKNQQIGVIVYTFDVSQQRLLVQRIMFTMVGTLCAILCLLGAIILGVTKRSILTPIQKIVTFAERMKGGNYNTTLDFPDNDEIGAMGAALNHAVLAQRQMIDQIHRSTIQVTSSSTELSATAKEQEVTMQTQVESTNNVLKSVEEISEVVKELVQTMEHVVTTAQEAAHIAGTGQENLHRMKTVMQQMEHASKSISGRLEIINEKAENITTVVTTITKVADQTNLLSLNAAIEAEKAGEYGHGFTVVAREIRRLADQTAMATLDIDQMVREMQAAVVSGVMEMDKFIAQVHHHTEDVGKTSAQLSQIIVQVQTLTPSFDLVNQSMKHQAENAEKIREAMMRLSEEMQEMKEALHENYSAISQLNEAARDLQDEVAHFTIG